VEKWPGSPSAVRGKTGLHRAADRATPRGASCNEPRGVRGCGGQGELDRADRQACCWWALAVSGKLMGTTSTLNPRRVIKRAVERARRGDCDHHHRQYHHRPCRRCSCSCVVSGLEVEPPSNWKLRGTPNSGGKRHPFRPSSPAGRMTMTAPSTDPSIRSRRRRPNDNAYVPSSFY
jgi:hypothetical protein